MERSTKPSDIPMQQWHHVSSAVDILPQEEQRINHIARQLSQHSQPDGSIAAHDVHTLSPVVSNDSFDILSPVKDSNLDPFSSKFDVKDWARRMLALWHNDQVNNPVRSCGVAFKNVNVYGYGSEFGYLSTVGNLPMSLFGSLVNAVNPKRQGRIDILNGFDGVLQEGEMLMVLGPPGR
jgi:ATP-binding cassette subfamily G (WHITE) protein 2 (PDR)